MKYLILLFMLTFCTPKVKHNPQYEVDVKPILQFKCYSCHGIKWLDRQIFDLNLNKIQYMVIETRKMPPGGLTSYEYDTIRNYIDNRLKD